MKAFYLLCGKIFNFDLTLFDLASSIAVASLTRAVPSPIGLFSVVQFPNDACDTTDATPLTGTCLTSTECTGRGGTPGGNCAAGFGVCCVVAEATCTSSGTSI